MITQISALIVFCSGDSCLGTRCTVTTESFLLCSMVSRVPAVLCFDAHTNIILLLCISSSTNAIVTSLAAVALLGNAFTCLRVREPL
jgi:hypothetical protein